MKKIIIFLLLPFLTIGQSYTELDNFSSGYLSGYGHSIALFDNIAAVGSYTTYHNGKEKGRAYLYEKQNGNWVEIQQLHNHDTDYNSWFGHSVAISENYVIVGAVDEEAKGSVHIFEKVMGEWVEYKKLQPNDLDYHDGFGYSVAISGDRLVVGSRGAGVYVYRNLQGNWVQEQKLLPNNGSETEWYGHSVDIHGNQIVVGNTSDDTYATNNGSAYVYKKDFWTGGWIEEQRLMPEDTVIYGSFGGAVSIFDDQIVVGMYFDNENGLYTGSAYIYKKENGVWTREVKLLASSAYPSEKFGSAVDITNNKVIVGAHWTIDHCRTDGRAYIYEKQAEVWNEIDVLMKDQMYPSGKFGFSVAISDCNVLVGDEEDCEAFFYDSNCFTEIEDDVPDNANIMTIYPNPVHDILTVSIPTLKQDDMIYISLCNSMGQEILNKQDYRLTTSHETYDLYVGNIPQGVYVLSLKYGENEVLNSKFVKH